MTWNPTERELDAAERVLFDGETERISAMSRPAAQRAATPDGYWRPLAEAVLEAAHQAEPGNKILEQVLEQTEPADAIRAYVDSITRRSLFESTDPPAATSREQQTWEP